jgi:hypothetical protein
VMPAQHQTGFPPSSKAQTLIRIVCDSGICEVISYSQVATITHFQLLLLAMEFSLTQKNSAAIITLGLSNLEGRAGYGGSGSAENGRRRIVENDHRSRRCLCEQ